MPDTSSGAVATTPPAPVRENVGRGTLAALVTIPVGVAAWVLIWGLGYMASIVGALAAFLAMRLYVWGAGRISRLGALVVLLTTAVTLVLAFLGGIAYDAVMAFSEGTDLGAWGTLTHPNFWPVFGEILPEVLPDYTTDLLWALGFGALGSFAVLRSAFAAAETPEEPTTEQPGTDERFTSTPAPAAVTTDVAPDVDPGVDPEPAAVTPSVDPEQDPAPAPRQV